MAHSPGLFLIGPDGEWLRHSYLRHSGRRHPFRPSDEVLTHETIISCCDPVVDCISGPCETVTVGDLSVAHGWSKVTIGAGRPGVFYVSISNAGATDDALVGISTPAAGMPMLHETVLKDGVASMPHAMSIPVPAGQSVQLSPRGYHGMLMGSLMWPEGGWHSFPVTLSFEKAGEVTVNVEVLSLRAEGPDCADAEQ